MNALDFCPGCGERVGDFATEGFEDGDTGQRGHFSCVVKSRRCLQRKEQRKLDGLGWCQLEYGHTGNCDADADATINR